MKSTILEPTDSDSVQRHILNSSQTQCTDGADGPSTYSFDDAALREIEKLVGMSRLALEEAASYFADMTDPVKRAAAERLIESV